MKIIDGIKLKGRPAEIPDCSRDDLPQFFIDRGYKVGAEIGVEKGKFAEILCRGGLKIYAIDPWLQYPDFTHPKGQKRLDAQYEHAKRILAQYDCTILRKTSMEALSDFKDESLDFVYIDGNHHFKYVAQDICEWSKKVKKGGIISGHDYFYPKRTVSLEWKCLTTCHVQYVADAYTKAYDIRNWYVLGQEIAVKGERRDRSPSWMWSNP